MSELATKKLLIIGSFRSINGIAVHLQRLVAKAKPYFQEIRILEIDKSGARYMKADGTIIQECKGALSTALFPRKVLADFSPDIVHSHISTAKKFAWVWNVIGPFVSRKAAVAVTLHTGAIAEKQQGFDAATRFFFKRFMRRCNGVISVTPNILDFVGALTTPATKVSVIPAFLPPVVTVSDGDRKMVEDLRAGGRKIVIMSGGCAPLYGFHLALDAFERTGRKANCSVIFAFYNVVIQEYRDSLQAKLDQGFSYKVLMDTEPARFQGLLSMSDLYLRSSDRDGDCVAIREAAALGKQVLASDVAFRPAKTLLYDYNNTQDFDSKLNTVLDTPGLGIPVDDSQGFFDNTIEFYRSIVR